MIDNSQNSELLEPKSQEKEETIPQEGMADQKEEIVNEKSAPKSRGRPAGVKDTKPRIKRVPVQQPPQQQQETAANEATPTPPNKPRKNVEIRHEEEEPHPEDPVEEEPPPPRPVTRRSSAPQRAPKRVQIVEEEESEEELPSPRTKRHQEWTAYRKNRADAHQANVNHYARMFDRMLA